MANRRFEMYKYRQALVRMRQGDSDRRIRRAGLMGGQRQLDVPVSLPHATMLPESRCRWHHRIRLLWLTA